MAKTNNMKKRWRDAFGLDEVVQRVRPEKTDKLLNNPHKGTATFQRFNGDKLYPGLDWDDREGPMWFRPPGKIMKNKLYPDTTISYCRWAWALLEPEQGKIRFDIIDQALEAARLRGQTLQFRTQPCVGDNGPKWYLDLIGETEHNIQQNTGRSYMDHTNPLYLKEWGRHIKAIGKRYDGHPNLESVDISIAGPCGETGGNAPQQLQIKIANIYLNAFKKTPLLSLINKVQKYLNAKQSNKRPLGWRQDCFGDFSGDLKKLGGVPDHLCWNHMYDAYPKVLAKNNMGDNWKKGPVTLETCWTVAFWKKMNWDIDEILEQGLKYHPTVFMPKSVFIPKEWADKIYEFNKKIGYRFYLHQMNLPLEIKANQSYTTEITIDNRGCAPIYHDYKFALQFVQGKKSHVITFKQDIRAWLPDFTFFAEKITIPKALKKGEVKVFCSIVNDNKKPVVKLAIKKITDDGWHPLTSIDII